MATLEQLERALKGAIAAGDMDAARKLQAVVNEARQDMSNQIPGAGNVPGTTPEKPKPTFGQRLKGAGEAALTVGTGIPASIVGGLSGVASVPVNLAQRALGSQSPVDPEQVTKDVTGAFTYIPRSETGREFVQGIGEAAEPLQAVPGIQNELAALGMAAKGAAPALGAVKDLVGASKVMQVANGVQNNIKSAIPSIRPKAPAQALQEAAQGSEGALPGVAKSAGEAAEELGIRTFTTDYLPPQTNAGKFVQRIFEKIPLAGTGGNRAEQQAQRVAAIKKIAAEYGADADGAFDEAIYRSLTQKKAERINTMQSVKQSVKDQLPMEAPVPVEKTLQAFDKEIANLEALQTPGATAKADVLKQWREAFEKNKNFDSLDSIRAEFGTTIKGAQQGDIRTALEQVSSKLYPAVKEDMRAFIRQHAGDSSARRWTAANEVLANGINEINRTRLRAVLNNGQRTPEVVNNLLFSQKPSEVQLLMRSLTPEGQRAAQAAVIQKAIKSSGGLENVSPDRFVNSLDRMGPQVKNVFQGVAGEELTGLQRALNFTRRAGQAVANPETGAQLTLPHAVAGVTGAIGGVPGLSAIAFLGLVGRAYESKAVRNALLRMARSEKGSKAEADAFNAVAKAAQKGANEGSK